MSVKAYHITLNGKVYEVEIEEVKVGQSPKATHIANQEHVSVNGEKVTAPMPGSMSNILVREKQTVKKGDVLAILEAMKMENEIISPVDGIVSDINVEKGQTVNLGDVILTIS